MIAVMTPQSSPTAFRETGGRGEAPMTIVAIVWMLCLAGFLCCAEGAKVTE